MKKQFFFFFFLFLTYQCSAQDAKSAPNLHIGNRYKTKKIKLNVAEAKSILYRKFDDFYIAGVKDNRVEKTDCIGKVRDGQYYNISIEGDSSVAYTLQTFLRYFASSADTKIPIYANLNTISMGENVMDQYSPYATLDIDFYKKDEKGALVFVSHYHGMKDRKYDEAFNPVYSKLLYTIFREALNTINVETSATPEVKANFTDTTYLPKVGVYRTVEDYCYNTPYIPSDYAVTNYYTVFKTQSDSLLFKRIFGYCDGLDFYVFPSPIASRTALCKSLTRGRYLFIKNGVIESTPKEDIARGVGYGLGGVVGLTVALSATSISKDIIYDTEKGDYYTMIKDDFSTIFADYPDFVAALKLAKNSEHSDMILKFVQKLNTENHGLRARRD